MDNKVLGREYKRGLKEGREEGRKEAEVMLVRRLIEARFGTLPEWAEARLANRSVTEIEDLAVRLLKSESLEELFQ